MSIGIDIVEITRVERAAARPGFIRRVYTERERASFSEVPRRAAEQMAGRFAAKEAVVKVLGRLTCWHDIEILSLANGSPVVELHGLSRELSEGRRVVVSITHTQNYAAAVAALEPVTDDGR
ncbi:MAG: holo-ACP synthase [Armatimonadetes bacterium]|nr:holo-ACP synthase [Armatimonadota bacterium]